MYSLRRHFPRLCSRVKIIIRKFHDQDKDRLSDVNRVTINGFVGHDPDIRGRPDYPVIVFPVITTEKFQTKSGQINELKNWHRVSVIDPKLQKYVYDNVRKSDKVLVAGSLSHKQYTKNDGHTETISSVVASSVDILWIREAKIFDETESGNVGETKTGINNETESDDVEETAEDSSPNLTEKNTLEQKELINESQ